MPVARILQAVATAAVCAVAASCATTTEIVSVAPADTTTDEATTLAFADDGESAETEPIPEPEPEPAPEPTPEPDRFPDDPEGWGELAASSYRIALPEGWVGISSGFKVEAALTELYGEQPDPYEVLFYKDYLSYGDSVVALSADGHDLYAYREIGNASVIQNPERVTRRATSELWSFAENVEVTSTSRQLDGRAAVVVTGTYDYDGDTWDVYAFVTQEGLHAYTLVISFVAGTDPKIADQMLESFALI